jgi:2-polyprenyl-6-methoxyphenol hydroxylase-like FAD-dependent oxidoreductase
MGADAVDVVVVGAGPVGLAVAAELALRGTSVRVLERLTEPDTTIKAGSINVPTAEALDRRGLGPAVERVQRAAMAEVAAFLGAEIDLSRPPDKAGHFGGIMLDRALVDPDDPDITAHRSAARTVVVPQGPLEELLAEHAAGLGVVVERGVEVTGLVDAAGAVTVDTSAGPVTARWVVGCDGGRSVVRRLAGFDFPGTDGEITGHQAIVDVADPEVLERGWTWTPTGVYCHGPLPGRILTVTFDGPPSDRQAPVTLAELQDALRRASGTGVTLTALRGAGTRWTDNARQADTYRRGRVLLAGDAAHVHSPFGGQGLNLGVGDAVNLGWKLAAVVAGWAGEDLLDTYTAERHPLGARVLDWTRAQVALMRGDPKTAALRDVVTELLGTRAPMTTVVKRVTGLDQRLELGGPDAHRLVGRTVGDLALGDGTRLAEVGHDGVFLLLDRTPDGALARLAAGWPDRVRAVTDPSVEAPAGVIVRPDGVVAWAVDDACGLDALEAAEAALRRWAGVPRAASAGV